jgi:short-subunit dehydrogenase
LEEKQGMITTVVRNAIAAGATAFAMAFSQMDANPSLFVHDKLFVSDRRLDEQFKGKTMWITGASSGIGAELAMQLSRHGVNLILSARPSDRLNLVAEECRRRASDRGKGNTVTVVPADFSADVSDLETTIDNVLAGVAGGSLDFVVLNAGSGQLRPASLTKHEVTEQVFKLNTLAPIALTQILLERGALREDGGRHLVITSSVGAKFGVPLSASYAASKHALHGYYNSLKAELPWLRVDLICPGSTDTDFHQSHIGGSGSTDTKADTTKKAATKLKMPTRRCSELLISSMTMSHSQGGEYWIAEHPVLLGLYFNQLFPGLFQKTLSKIGPMRVRAWEEGLDLYDPSTWKQMKGKDSEDGKR